MWGCCYHAWGLRGAKGHRDPDTGLVGRELWLPQCEGPRGGIWVGAVEIPISHSWPQSHVAVDVVSIHQPPGDPCEWSRAGNGLQC